MSMCKHKRLLEVGAKASDLQNYAVPHLGLDHDGYAPHITHLCGGDYIEFSICLDCGVVVGFKPISDEEIIAIFGDL